MSRSLFSLIAVFPLTLACTSSSAKLDGAGDSAGVDSGVASDSVIMTPDTAVIVGANDAELGDTSLATGAGGSGDAGSDGNGAVMADAGDSMGDTGFDIGDDTGGTGTRGDAPDDVGVIVGGECHDLDFNAPLLKQSRPPDGAPPPATGGTISAGIYELVSDTLYQASSTCPNGDVAARLVVRFFAHSATKGVMEKASVTQPGPTVRTSADYTLVGNRMMLEYTCPLSGAVQSRYFAATPTEIVIEDPISTICGTDVWVLKRR